MFFFSVRFGPVFGFLNPPLPHTTSLKHFTFIHLSFYFNFIQPLHFSSIDLLSADVAATFVPRGCQMYATWQTKIIFKFFFLKNLNFLRVIKKRVNYIILPQVWGLLQSHTKSLKHFTFIPHVLFYFKIIHSLYFSSIGLLNADVAATFVLMWLPRGKNNNFLYIKNIIILILLKIN